MPCLHDQLPQCSLVRMQTILFPRPVLHSIRRPGAEAVKEGRLATAKRRAASLMAPAPGGIIGKGRGGVIEARSERV